MSYLCRVCFDEGDNISDFISPCCCTGSVLHIHKECLNLWLKSSSDTDNYFRCQDCLCHYNRSKIPNKENVVNSKVGIFSIITTIFSTMVLISLIIFCNFSIIFCTVMLFLVYMMTLFFFAIRENLFYFYLVILIFIIICYSNQKTKLFLTDMWLILVFSILSFYYISDGWNNVYKIILKNENILFKNKMFDNYTKKFVDGII